MRINFSLLKKKMGSLYPVILLILFAFILFFLLYSSVRQKNVTIRMDQLAEETIRAPKTVINTYETEEKQRLAEEAVLPVYVYQEDVKTTQTERVRQLFTLVKEVNNKAENDYQERVKKAKDGETIPQTTNEEKIAALKAQFEKLDHNVASFYQKLPTNFYKLVFILDTNELMIAENESVKLISAAMSEKIRETNLEAVRQTTDNQIQYLDASSSVQQVLRYVTNQGIVVNEVTNESKTKELKQKAKQEVTPVMIYQGEIIVREGVQIDQKAMHKLELVGLTNQTISVFPMVALALLILLQIGMVVFLGYQTKDFDARMRYLTFYVSLMIVSVSVMRFLQLFQTDSMTYVPLLFPAAFTPLVLNLFVSRRTGILAAVFQVAFALMAFYENIGTSSLLIISTYYAFTGSMATLIRRKRIGEQVQSASLWLVIFPALFAVILIIYQGMALLEGNTITTFVCAVTGCILSFLLSVGLHPYIELLLNDDSMIVLNELSNPNHPLLKRLLEEAPGTYHHSMMVANLSANAVAEIGGRSLLTRVACYYHDIGKIKHANFFVENLPDGAENPHNFLLPKDSKQIIFGHVTGGAEILRNEKMPKLVVDICEQHHGTTLMRYFYVKAKEREADVTKESFRYPGPKPQTREAGVVSIADSAEAAVRAMDQPTNKKIQEFVHELIYSRIEDGQLDECGLTLAEIGTIEKSIVNGLCSSFHSRIKYPKMKSEAEEMKQEQEEKGNEIDGN